MSTASRVRVQNCCSNVNELQRVLIVGDGPASLEMSEAILKVCKGTLLISVKDPETSRFNASIENREVLKKVKQICRETKKILFEGGREEKVDIILLCTGYTYDFEIMPCIQMTKDRKRVLGLYEHMIFIDGTVGPSIASEEILQSQTTVTDQTGLNTGEPSLAIIGLPTMNSVFLVAEAQSAFIARYFSGRLRIPTAQMKIERDAKAEQFKVDVENRKRNVKQFHTLDYPRDAEYIDDLFKKCVEAEDTGPMGTGKLPQFHTLKLHWLRDNMDAIRTAYKESAGGTESRGYSSVVSSWRLRWIQDCLPMAFMSTEVTKIPTVQSLGFEFHKRTASSVKVRDGAKIMKALQVLMVEKMEIWSKDYSFWRLIADDWKRDWNCECMKFRTWVQQ
jgi:hypothetical protein